MNLQLCVEYASSKTFRMIYANEVNGMHICAQLRGIGFYIYGYV